MGIFILNGIRLLLTNGVFQIFSNAKLISEYHFFARFATLERFRWHLIIAKLATSQSVLSFRLALEICGNFSAQGTGWEVLADLGQLYYDPQEAAFQR